MSDANDSDDTRTFGAGEWRAPSTGAPPPTPPPPVGRDGGGSGDDPLPPSAGGTGAGDGGNGANGRASSTSPLLYAGLAAAVVAIVVLVFVMRSGDDTARDADAAITGASVTTEPVGSGPSTATVDSTPQTDAPPTTQAAAPGPPTASDLARSVVQVQLLLGDQVTCTGSGTILRPDGTILTNSHVITQDAVCPHDRIGVAILDVPELPPTLLFEADVLVDDPALDLAVIRIARSLDGSPVTADFPTIEIGDSDSLTLGETLRVIGFPGIGGETITFTEGTISGFVSIPGLGDRSWLKTDATLSGGNSGGLAVDQTGRIVGIPTIVGTGEGRITDCRFVADTNGDGQITQEDACVPVGGFINGIRPVNLALPLLDAALTATPMAPTAPMVEAPMSEERPQASQPTWTLSVADGVATEPVLAAPAGAPLLCLTWQYSGVPTGAPFEVVWLIDGTEVPDAGAVGTNQGDTSGGFFACIENPAGLTPGTYELAWFVNDEPVFSDSAFVGGDRAPITITIVNSSPAALCVVQFAPTIGLTFGLNDIETPLEPGASVAIPLVTGAYDARVIDCDGALLIEDETGTELLENLTLDVSAN